jgi:hypothetical protein
MREMRREERRRKVCMTHGRDEEWRREERRGEEKCA